MDLSNLKGVGNKKLMQLQTLSIFSIEDLLHYYPSKLEFKDYTDLDSNLILIKIKVVSKTKNFSLRRNLSFFTIKGLYNNELLTFKIFNQPYLNSKVIVDSEISIECKKSKKDYVISKIIFSNEVPYIDIKYSSNYQINSKQIQKLIIQALKDYHHLLDDSISSELHKKYKLLSLKEAVYLIHSPRNIVDYQNAMRTLKYYEAYNFMDYLRQNRVEKKEFDFKEFNLDVVEDFIDSLEFELTKGQRDVITQVSEDMSENTLINRLIHGDVGCGKTLVSIIISKLFVANDYQVAILCPTEILAKQMYENYSKYLDDGILLTSALKPKELTEVYDLIANNNYKFVVGTHSLLNDKLSFNKLGLVIIDEQQRFGVEQREKLISKSNDVNTILMSATPIPRTVGLVLFDNIKLTPIYDLPKNRITVETEFATTLSKEIISDITTEIENDHLVYVVVPVINDGLLNVESIETVYEKYCKIFKKKDIGVVHSKLKAEEIEKTMLDFKAGKIKILIATSIIEVGIDVANASRIIIHSASRFGLATLHQLRGRVGRSNIASKCYIINEKATERLDLFVECSDGFEVSEADYKMRGPGNLIGTEQSGYNMFKLLDVVEDFKVLQCAKDDVLQSK